MPDDAVYNATSQLAADAATLAMKAAIAGLVAGVDGVRTDPRLTSAIASAAVAIDRSGNGSPAALQEGNQQWSVLHGAVARSLDEDGLLRQDAVDAGLTRRILSDVSVQTHSQGILDGLNDAEKAASLDLSDRNVMEAVRDGGDIEDLVRRRAAGAYDRLTLDQQDDVAEAVRDGSMMKPALVKEIDGAERTAAMIHAASPSMDGDAATLPAVTREAMERAEALSSGRARPQDAVEAAVVVHARAFPEPHDEAGVIARATALVNPGRGQPLDIALGIEKSRLAIHEAQERVANGTSSTADRNVAVGRGHSAEEPVAFQQRDIPMLDRARMARHLIDVQQEGVTRMAERSMNGHEVPGRI